MPSENATQPASKDRNARVVRQMMPVVAPPPPPWAAGRLPYSTAILFIISV